MTEKVILVDLNDVPVGEMGKMEAHKRALLHRAVSVFIFNTQKKLLIHQRAPDKYHSPGLWTNTACTHPYPGENNEDAVIRRLKEEMGLTVHTVKKLFHFTYREQLDNELTEYEFDHIFVGFSDELPSPDPREVTAYKYVDCREILRKVKEVPTNYTIWFRMIIERVVEEVEKLNVE